MGYCNNENTPLRGTMVKILDMLKYYHSPPILNPNTLDILEVKKTHNTSVTLWINRIRINALFKLFNYLADLYSSINDATF